ncbi:MAG: VOC family protein [Henriciella sp.]
MPALRPVLPVTDMARSLAFWRGLGFEVAFSDRSPAEKADYAGVRGHGLELHLQTFTAEQLGYTQTMSIRIEVETRNALEALHARWSTAATITAPLSEKPWGTVEFGFYDPDGTPFHVYCDA